MAGHASTLLLLGCVVGLASLASYFLSQWRARTSRETFALAGIGFGTALLLTAVFLLMFGMLLVAHRWLSSLQGAATKSEATVSDLTALPNPFSSLPVETSIGQISSNESADLDISRQNETSEQQQRTDLEMPEGFTATATRSTVPSVLPPSGRKQRTGALATNAPWAATRCVVPLRRDWPEGTRWTIVNDCGVAVAIVIATCERSASDCPNDAWRYSLHDFLLPAKHRRPTTEAEEVRYTNALRHVACAVWDEVAIALIDIDNEARFAQWQSELEETRARDACLRAARGLTQAGASSGLPIEALVGARF